MFYQSDYTNLLHKVFTSQVSNFMQLYNLFTQSQHALREGRNTRVISNLTEQLYENLNSSAIFLDLAKAFDNADHRVLIDKLPFYGLYFRATQVLESDLQNRK